MTSRGATERQVLSQDIAARWRAVDQRVHDACRRAGRPRHDVLVVAVTKTHPPGAVLDAINAGLRDFGENYVQELLEKRAVVEQTTHEPVRWHFIGHLQRNKVRFLVDFCHLIHALDSPRLADEINKRAARIGRRQSVLIEVNISGEATKFGIPPDELPELVRHVLALDALDLQGLMTMAPYSTDPEASRPIYRRLRQLRDELIASGVPPDRLRHLSMGMTQDFEVAIEEGATIVRIGTAIFGPRNQK